MGISANNIHNTLIAAVFATSEYKINNYEDVKETLEYVFAQLPARDVKMLISRYVFGKAYSEIGNTYGVSKECARQRLRHAERKMRELPLREYLINGKAYMDKVNDTKVKNNASSSVKALFSTRTYNAVLRSGIIDSLNDFKSLTASDLIKIRNLGAKGIREIKDVLAAHNISLKEEEE